MELDLIPRLSEALARLGLSPSTARLVVAAAVIAGVLVVARAAWSQVRRVRDAWGRTPAGRRRAARRQAAHALRHDRFTAAAESLAVAGDWDGARKLHEEAARLAERHGQTARAARHLAAAGRERDAARLLLKAGEWREAAALFERAGQPVDQARALESGGRLVEAARLFGRSRRLEDALRCLVRASSSSAPAEYRDRREEMAMKAAAVATRLGRHGKAAELLETAGMHAAAARAHVAAGDHARAAALLERDGDLAAAAEAHERAGDVEAGKRCRARLALEAGRADEAAALFCQVGDRDGAAAALEAQGRHGEAAELHERAGRFEHAGVLHGRAGDHAAAGRCFEQAGLMLRAGRAWQEAGDGDRAIRCYRAVPPGDSDATDARGLAALLLLEGGRHSDALHLLDDVLAELAPLGNAAPQLASWLSAAARCHEALGRTTRAAELARRALDVDRDDEKSQALLHRLGLGPAPDGAGTASGLAPERYRILRELASGGMGTVHLATDTLLDRPVALKVMSERWRDQPELRARFIREARLAARVTHSNIITVYDVGEHAGRPYMALEYVAGQDLRDLLKERGRLGVDETVSILRDVARALGAAHAKGVVHRDIKPGNIFLGDDGTIKVGDFGIARLQDGDTTLSGVIMGTPHYIPPEQVRGRPVDARADIYSLGATAYAMLCGRPPFTSGDVAWRHVNEEPPDPREHAPELPPGLAELVLACLSKRRSDRPASTDDFLQRLDVAAGVAVPA